MKQISKKAYRKKLCSDLPVLIDFWIKLSEEMEQNAKNETDKLKLQAAESALFIQRTMISQANALLQNIKKTELPQDDKSASLNQLIRIKIEPHVWVSGTKTYQVKLWVGNFEFIREYQTEKGAENAANKIKDTIKGQ